MSAKPRVWDEFTVKSKNGDLKLRVQDVPADRKDECMQMFREYFTPQETFHKAAGVLDNKDALEEAFESFAKVLESSKIVMCCIEDGSDNGGKLIAISAINLIKKGDPKWEDSEEQPKNQELLKLGEIVVGVSKMYNVMEQFNVDRYYDGRGVVTHPDYRGLGIAQRLFHIRRKMCTEDDVPLTGVMLSAIGSQKAAERDGWETIFEVSYEELGKLFGVTFEGGPTMCKYMVATPL